jgi:hypothetical protein
LRKVFTDRRKKKAIPTPQTACLAMAISMR